MRAGDYCESQFAFIAGDEAHREDAEFLHTLKLCYEAGLGRTFSRIEKLQKGIFGSLQADVKSMVLERSKRDVQFAIRSGEGLRRP